MSESVFADRIVQNLLDTDFYKLTMMQAVLHNYPNVEVEWEFRCRNHEDLRPYLSEIRHQIERLADVNMSQDQLGFLERITFMKPDFIRFLGLFRFNLRYVHTGIENGELFIRLRGPWLHVILFEVPLLAIVSEVRNRSRYANTVLSQAREQLYRKFDWLQANASADELAGLQVADFGTRRRFSYRVQEEVVNVLKHDFPGKFVGTSNVNLSRELDMKPLGTMAHEWIMAHQQLGPRLIDSQSAALDCWVREYRGLLGIALTDCITTDAFLKDFDLYFAKLFDGLRHDSGDPVEWGEKALAHYAALGSQRGYLDGLLNVDQLSNQSLELANAIGATQCQALATAQLLQNALQQAGKSSRLSACRMDGESRGWRVIEGACDDAATHCVRPLKRP